MRRKGDNPPPSIEPETLRTAKISLGVSWQKFAEALGYRGGHARVSLWEMAHGYRPIPRRVAHIVPILMGSAEARRIVGLPTTLRRKDDD